MEEQKEFSRHEENMLIFTIMLGGLVALLNSTTINIALPTFMLEFNAPITTVQWVVTGYMLSTGLITPLIGFWGDQYSNKVMYLVGLGLLALVSVACALSQTIEMLIAFRILQGVAGGIIMPVTSTLIYQFISRERQLMATAITSMSVSAGVAIGPSLAGVLLNFFTWPSIFWLNIPLCLICLGLAWRFVPVKIISSEQKLDLLGLVAAAVGTVGLLLGFNKGGDLGWTSPVTIGLIVIGALSLIFFVKHELSIQKPMLNFRVFKYSKFTYCVIMNSSTAIATCLSPFFMPLFLQNVMGMDALHSGLVLLFPSLVMALASPIAGKLGGKFSVRGVIFIAMLILLGSTFELSCFTLTTTVAGVSLWLSLRYAGIGLMTPLINNFGMAAVPQHLVGHASSMIGWTRQVISTLSVSIFTLIYSLRIMYHTANNMGATLNSADAQRQILCSSINDVTFYSLIILIFCVPIIYFFKDDPLARKTNG